MKKVLAYGSFCNEERILELFHGFDVDFHDKHSVSCWDSNSFLGEYLRIQRKSAVPIGVLKLTYKENTYTKGRSKG